MKLAPFVRKSLAARRAGQEPRITLPSRATPARRPTRSGSGGRPGSARPRPTAAPPAPAATARPARAAAPPRARPGTGPPRRPRPAAGLRTRRRRPRRRAGRRARACARALAASGSSPARAAVGRRSSPRPPPPGRRARTARRPSAPGRPGAGTPARAAPPRCRGAAVPSVTGTLPQGPPCTARHKGARSRRGHHARPGLRGACTRGWRAPSSAGRARRGRRAHLQGTSSSRCHSKKSSRQAARHSSHRLVHTAGRRPTPTRGSHTLRACGAALAPVPCSEWLGLCLATARAAPAREARDDRLAARRQRVVGQRRSQAAAERGRVRHVAAGAPGELLAEGQGLGLPGGLLLGCLQPQGALCVRPLQRASGCVTCTGQRLGRMATTEAVPGSCTPRRPWRHWLRRGPATAPGGRGTGGGRAELHQHTPSATSCR